MSQIKERPILFSAPMVRAILEGRKTVTRRTISHKLTNRFDEPRGQADVDAGYPFVECEEGYFPALNFCPYGQIGDRLWVRETFIDMQGTGVEHRPDPDDPLQRYAYAADYRPGSHSDEVRKDFGLKHKPSIHMPRAACRILLEITDVRVERLQGISGDQAEAEGVDAAMCQQFLETSPSRHQCKEAVIHGFAGLWQSTGGDWDANPWVWVVEFKRVTP